MSDTESVDTQVSAKTLLQDDDINMESENMVFNPYNSLNKEITLNDVQSILTKYGVPGKVFNINLCGTSFPFSSLINSVSKFMFSN